MTIKTLLISAVFAIISSTAVLAAEKQPAFPGAEGYARYVTGGRGGKVFYVTNLNDSGEGSLRWAVNQTGKRTILFKVSGTIFLKSALSINNGDVTIAGQSAPGDGICVADYPFTIQANNVILRYMRFRLGNRQVANHEGDGLGAMDHEGIMIDHCSVSWSIDECLSVLGNKNTTVQWCISSHSLVNAGHVKGSHGYGGNWGGNHASFHHNLMIHHVSRTPRLGPRVTTQLEEHMDMRNNVIYNWAGNGCYGGEGMDVNIVNNYYKPGPGTPDKAVAYRLAGIGVRTNEYVATYPAYAPALHKWGHLYVDGNVNPSYSNVTNNNWTYGIYNQIDASGNDGTFTSVTRDTIKLSEPIDFIYTTTHSARDAYARVLDYVGCSRSRDSYDLELISDARNGSASHKGSGLSSGFINTQEDLKPAGTDATWSPWPELNSAAAPADTDGDGMPDDYENTVGLNPADATDGNAVADNGYTNLENYLNGLVADITEAQNEGGTPEGDIEESKEYTPGSYDEIAEGSIAWPVNDNTSSSSFGKNPIVSAALADYIVAHDATVGSNLTTTSGRIDRPSVGPLSGTQYLYRIGCVQTSSSADGTNDFTYTVTPNSDCFFLPTRVTALVSKVGTDGGNAQLLVCSDTESESAYNGSPSRNEVNSSKGNNNYTSIDYTLQTPVAASDAASVVLRLTALSNSKAMGVGTVILYGKVVKPSSGDGIEEIRSATPSVNQRICSMDGRVIANTSVGNRFPSLQPGVYIVGDRKIAVK